MRCQTLGPVMDRLSPFSGSERSDFGKCTGWYGCARDRHRSAAHVVGMTQTQQNRLGLLTPAELSELLGVSERTLEDWRNPRRGPDGPNFVKLGGQVRYRLETVEQWIIEQETGGTSKDAEPVHQLELAGGN